MDSKSGNDGTNEHKRRTFCEYPCDDEALNSIYKDSDKDICFLSNERLNVSCLSKKAVSDALERGWPRKILRSHVSHLLLPQVYVKEILR